MKSRTCWRFFEKRGKKFFSKNGTLHEWPVGEWVKHAGDLELCASGLHASTDVYQAFQHAQGDTLAEVEVRGVGKEEDGKLVARELRIVKIFDDRRYVVALAGLAAIRALPSYEKSETGDAPRKAVEAVIAWVGAEPGSKAASASASAARAASAEASAAWAASAEALAASAEASASASAASASAEAARASAASAARASASASAARAAFHSSFQSDALRLLETPAGELGAWLAEELKEQDKATRKAVEK